MASSLFSIITPCKPLFTVTFSHGGPHKQGTGLQHVWFCNYGPALHCRVKTWFKFSGTLQGLGLGNNFSLGMQDFQLNMSGSGLASHFSALEVNAGVKVPSVDSEDSVCQNVLNGEVGSVSTVVEEKQLSARKFCKRCCKAASLCICHYIKIVVKNQTTITILQHPLEKKHHLGSARIALLGLQNVELISIPEVDPQVSYRMRPKVPGSKRFITGRGGKKSQLLETNVKKDSLKQSGPKLPVSQAVSQVKQELTSKTMPPAIEEGGDENLSESSSEDHQLVECNTVPTWLNLLPDAGLLFPSDQALDLWPVGLELMSSSTSELTFQSNQGKYVKAPSQLIVLDGTWSKAKRIFLENPWLHSLPHYRLLTLQHSRYGFVRREPKLGFLSTVESIVYALQLLEPETKDLNSLLDVFDSMI